MKRNWTRREFGLGAMAIATGAACSGAGAAQWERKESGLAFVGSAPANEPGDGSIHLFRTAGERWTALGTVPAAAPAHLLLHPTLPVLYAVHRVDTWNHLPRGVVSAYRVDGHAGRLHLLGTQPLSLSATLPRHAVLTGGATHLFVAAEGGGIYNLLPVAADGSLLAVSAIHKEFGMEEGGLAKPAAPNSVALLPNGALLAADAGLETLTRFTLVDGTLRPTHRLRVHRGEGPRELALSPGGRFAYTTGAATGELRRHRLALGNASDEVALARRFSSPLAPAMAYVPDAISLLQV